MRARARSPSFLSFDSNLRRPPVKLGDSRRKKNKTIVEVGVLVVVVVAAAAVDSSNRLTNPHKTTQDFERKVKKKNIRLRFLVD